MKKLCLFLSLFSLLSAESADMRSKLIVKGEAHLHKPADEMRLSLGVVTESQSVEKALSENNRQMNLIIEALENVGLTKEEMRTGTFSVQPNWSRPPHPQEEGWRSTIIGYTVTNTLALKTDKLDKAAVVIDTATKAGANTLDSISFGLKNPRIYREEAIRAASANAQEEARILSEANQQKLLRILEIILDEAEKSGPAPRISLASYGKMASNYENVPINPGDVEVSATTTLIYEIAPK